MNKIFSKKRIIFFAVIWLLFLALLMSLNQIVYATIKTDIEIKEISGIDSLSSNRDVLYGIIVLQNVGGWTKESYIRGWAVLDGDEPVVKAPATKVVLSGSHTYLIDTVAIFRNKTATTIDEKREVITGDIGFESGFSAIPIAQGQYDIYLYLEDENGNTGLVKTDHVLILPQ